MSKKKNTKVCPVCGGLESKILDCKRCKGTGRVRKTPKCAKGQNFGKWYK